MDVDNHCFPSLHALRTTHSDLLRRYQAKGGDPEALRLIESFVRKGAATGVLLENDDERWAAQGFLDYWSALLYRLGQEPPEATIHSFNPRLIPTAYDRQCPYVGLRAYTEADQAIFYGREDLLAELLTRLKTERLLIVSGASATGKTSLMLGGLLPKLKVRSSHNRLNWSFSYMRAVGENPLENLARLVCSNDSEDKTQIANFVEQLRLDSNYLSEFIERIRDDRSHFIIIDQLEELFTRCLEPTHRHTFLGSLLSLVQIPESSHTVVLVLQSEYEPKLAEMLDFASILQELRIFVAPPNAKELGHMISTPAELVGLKLEADVVDALVADVLREPDCLALLQFLLTGLWHRRDLNQITWQTYQELGRGRQAIIQQAETCFKEMSFEERAIARQIILGLVQVKNGRTLVKHRLVRDELARTIDLPLLQTSHSESDITRASAVDSNITLESLARGTERNNSSLEAGSQAPASNRGEIALKRDLMSVLKERFSLEYEANPPLFPWESVVKEYPDQIPQHNSSRMGPSPWIDYFGPLSVVNLLPKSQLDILLQGCIEIVAVPVKQGVRLVRAVEALFPEQLDT